MGLRRPALGGVGEIFGALITAGVEIYKVEKAEDMAEERMEFEEAQAARAAAREAEALRIQQETVKSMQAEKAKEAGAQGEILGMAPTTFYTAAGIGLGAVMLLGTMVMKKG
jgi:hypothetical protein